jgi:hypothetical protein
VSKFQSKSRRRLIGLIYNILIKTKYSNKRSSARRKKEIGDGTYKRQ